MRGKTWSCRSSFEVGGGGGWRTRSTRRPKRGEVYDVCRRDDEVDAHYKQLLRELVSYMAEDSKSITRALHLLLIGRNYERIADHATNIGEDVVFYVEGRDIRHMTADEKAGETA